MKKILIVLMLMFSVTGNVAYAELTAEKKGLTDLATSICSLYNKSKDIPGDSKKYISKFMKSNGYGAPTTENMIKFLNENKDELACFGRNYIKQAVKKRRYKPMIFKFLISEMRVPEKNMKIDFNAVDIVEGMPESVLDYIDSIIADEQHHGKQYIKEVTRLRKILANDENGFGAKNFRDFPKDVQERYLKQID